MDLLQNEELLQRVLGTSDDIVAGLRQLQLPDSFWCYEFKVVPCQKATPHKWTLCPCSHAGETARRRCPRTVSYKPVLCPLVKAKKTCPLGDACSYAHNVFEHWLHPARYKTRLCSFGHGCNRSICFFAHSAEELRCPPAEHDYKDTPDERDYLVQLIMAQDSGMLPQGTLQQHLHAQQLQAQLQAVAAAGLPDLSGAGLGSLSAHHQSPQQQQRIAPPRMPMSARTSMSGMGDPSMLLGMQQHHGHGASLSGGPSSATAVLDRAMSLDHHGNAAAAAAWRPPACPWMRCLRTRTATAAAAAAAGCQTLAPGTCSCPPTCRA